MLLGQGYRLPTWFLRFVAHSIVITLYPIVQFFFWKSYRCIGRDLPFFRVDQMTLAERYQAQVFYCFDTCLPRYQWWHPIKQVEGWLVEEGLEPVLNAHSFYTGSNVPVPSPAHKAERSEVGAAS
jgi:hypothetical protein